MNWTRIVKLIVAAGLLAGLILFKHRFNELSPAIDLPDRFEHTLYRVLLSFLALECARLIIILAYRPQNPKRKKDNFTIGVGHVSRLVYTMMAGVLLLSMFNISLKEALTSLSLIAAAIVLITKEYIANVINGMYLTFNKVVNIGDQVKVGQHKGKILDITLTNVHLLNDDDDIIYLPNNMVFSSEIINYTRRDLKRSSVDFEVDPKRASNLDELEKKLIDSLKVFSEEIQPGSYNLKTIGVKKDYLQLKFQYTLLRPLDKELDKKVRKYFLHRLVAILRERKTPSTDV